MGKNKTNDIQMKEYPENEQDIIVSEIKLTYSQENENNNSIIDTLEVSTDTQGDGFYFIIKTDRWAFEKVEDLVKVLNDFKNKAKF